MYRVDITGKGEMKWSTNGLCFKTEEEAKTWLNGLADRWFGFDAGRVVPDSTPEGEPFDKDDQLILINYK